MILLRLSTINIKTKTDWWRQNYKELHLHLCCVMCISCTVCPIKIKMHFKTQCIQFFLVIIKLRFLCHAKDIYSHWSCMKDPVTKGLKKGAVFFYYFYFCFLLTMDNPTLFKSSSANKNIGMWNHVKYHVSMDFGSSCLQYFW